MSEHASNLAVQIDTMWLFKRCLTSLSSDRKFVSGISQTLKAGNDISKIYVITLSGRHVAYQNSFSRVLSEF